MFESTQNTKIELQKLSRGSLLGTTDVDSSVDQLHRSLYANLLQEETYNLLVAKKHNSNVPTELAQATNDEKKDEAEQANTNKVDVARLNRLVQNLEDTKFDIRKGSYDSLLKIAEKDPIIVVSALKEAVNSADLDVKLTSRHLVEELFERDISSSTPFTDRLLACSENKNRTNAALLLDLYKYSKSEQMQSKSELATAFSKIISSYRELNKDEQERLVLAINSAEQIKIHKEQMEGYLARTAHLSVDMEQIKDTKDRETLFTMLESCPYLTGLTIQKGKLTEDELKRICALPRLENLAIACTNIKQLPQLLSKNLGYLDISESNIEQVELPETLSSFIAADSKLKTLPKLPNALGKLDISGTQVSELPELNEKLISLIASHCKQLTKLSKLPDSLVTLEVNNCPELIEIAGLSSKQEKLNAGNCPKLEKIGSIPEKLQLLFLKSSNVQDLTVPEKSNLTDLYLSNSKIRNLNLPKDSKLNNIDLDSCKELKEIFIPASVGSLNLSNSGIQNLSLPDKSNLGVLHANNCHELVKISGSIPELSILEANNCPKLEEVPALSSKLHVLDLSYSKIKNLNWPEIPTVRDVNLSHCDQLEQIPRRVFASTSLERIDVTESKKAKLELPPPRNLDEEGEGSDPTNPYTFRLIGR